MKILIVLTMLLVGCALGPPPEPRFDWKVFCRNQGLMTYCEKKVIHEQCTCVDKRQMRDVFRSLGW